VNWQAMLLRAETKAEAPDSKTDTSPVDPARFCFLLCFCVFL
jgi:hypothetical protein